MTGNMPSSSLDQLLQLLGQVTSGQNSGDAISPQVVQQLATAPPSPTAPTQQALAGQLYQPQYGSNWATPSQVAQGWGQVAAGGGSPQAAPQQQGGGLRQPSWQQTPPQQPGGYVMGGNVQQATPQGTGQVIGQQFPGTRTMAGASPPPGLLQPGNIDLYNRPQVKNADGTISTVRSISVDIGGKSYLIPTVAADGSGVLTNDQAIQQFRQTGQHLGIFDNHQNADAYSQTLHEQQDQLYNPNLQGGP